MLASLAGKLADLQRELGQSLSEASPREFKPAILEHICVTENVPSQLATTDELALSKREKVSERSTASFLLGPDDFASG